MLSPSASSWPTPGDDSVKPANIRWESVKTEEEEYLDKLQSKLSRIMKSDRTGTSTCSESVVVDPDDLPDEISTTRKVHDDDPGLHLLYEFPHQGPRAPSPAPSAPSERSLKPVARPRLVRFRSRVRITSGVHHTASASSSTCESASSSISAPLRGIRREIDNTRAPLSSLLSSDVANAWLRGLGSVRKPGGRQRHRGSATVNERSPLVSANGPRVRAYTESISDEEDDDEYTRMQAAARKSEEEIMFGKWPWRLINRHWWWWKLEPFICCCGRFYDESDDA